MHIQNIKFDNLDNCASKSKNHQTISKIYVIKILSIYTANTTHYAADFTRIIHRVNCI